MNNGINLATNTQQVQSKAASEKIRTLRFIAIGVLFVVASASVIFFILIATSPLPKLKEEETSGLQSLGRHHSDIAKLSILKERSETIQKLITTRPPMSKINQTIMSKLSEGVAVQTFAVKSNIVTLTVTSKSLTQLNTFIENMIRGSQQKEFSRVVLEDLSVDSQDGQFLVTMEVGVI